MPAVITARSIIVALPSMMIVYRALLFFSFQLAKSDAQGKTKAVKALKLCIKQVIKFYNVNGGIPLYI
jgi:hypothetical protein